MSDDFQNARFQRAAYESSVVYERLVLERSKNETAALNRNLREFDAKTRKRKIRNYALIGVGSFAVGAVLSVAAFQSLGLLTLPEISYRKPEVKAQAAATPTPSSVAAVAAVPAITQATPTTPKDEPIKIVTSTPDAVVPTSTTTTVDVKKSVFQVSPVKQVAAPAAKPKTSSAIQITPNAQAKPAIIPPTKDTAASDELGFKPASNYTVVSIPAEGVLMVKKNGESTQQMVRIGGRLPDGEELRSANPSSKEVETTARKFILKP